MRPFLIYEAVGKVIMEESNNPFMQPITTKPFMLVILAVTTREFKPETGELILRMGVAKN